VPVPISITRSVPVTASASSILAISEGREDEDSQVAPSS
jgi:hypothetical protein